MRRLVHRTILALLALGELAGLPASATNIDVRIDDPLGRVPLDGRVIVALSRTPEFNVSSVTDTAQLFGASLEDFSGEEASGLMRTRSVIP